MLFSGVGQLSRRGSCLINGDAAFALGPSMITPSNNDPELDDFDFYQSSNRMAIECAFGVLVRRWGIFWCPLRVRFDTALRGPSGRLLRRASAAGARPWPRFRQSTEIKRYVRPFYVGVALSA